MPQCSGAFADEGFITQELLLCGFSLLANSVILVLLCVLLGEKWKVKKKTIEDKNHFYFVR